MIDQYGRTIDYLRLSVTDLCNYRCRYCMPEEGVEKGPHGSVLSVEECGEIARAAVRCGVRKIRVTGGEPLVRRGILDICRTLRAIPELEELCLTTNGSLLPELAQPLWDAGVDRLNISLDTLQPERFREITRWGTLEEVLSGIRAAEDTGFRHLKLDTVLMGGVNDDEIGDFLNLTRAHPWEARFIELMPMGPCAAWPKERFLSVTEVLKRFPELEKIEPSGVARRWVTAFSVTSTIRARPCSLKWVSSPMVQPPISFMVRGVSLACSVRWCPLGFCRMPRRTNGSPPVMRLFRTPSFTTAREISPRSSTVRTEP